MAPGRPLDTAVREVCAWYAARGLPPMIAVPFPLAGAADSPVDRLLASLGWPLRRGAAVVMTAAVEAAAGRAGPDAPVAAAAAVTVAAAPDEDWLAMYHYRGNHLPPIGRRLLMSASWQAFASLRQEGQTVAIGRVAGDAD